MTVLVEFRALFDLGEVWSIFLCIVGVQHLSFARFTSFVDPIFCRKCGKLEDLRDTNFLVLLSFF